MCLNGIAFMICPCENALRQMLHAYETLRRSHFVDNRLTDVYVIVSLTPFIPRNIPGAHFC
jgi:hypothetical protein